MGLPVRGIFFLYDKEIAFCNDNHLVFLDVELEGKPFIIEAGNTETCKARKAFLNLRLHLE